jgi:hypothetical protein
MTVMEEKNPLFSEITPEEAAVVSGGNKFRFDLNTYLFILGAGVQFGNPGLTREEVQFAWEKSFVFESPSPLPSPPPPRRRQRRFFGLF